MGFAGAPELRGGFWEKILIYQTLSTLTASKCADGHCKVSEGDKEQCPQCQEGEDTTPSAGQRCPGCLSLRRAREGWEQRGIPDTKTRLLAQLLMAEVQTYKGNLRKAKAKNGANDPQPKASSVLYAHG